MPKAQLQRVRLGVGPILRILLAQKEIEHDDAADSHSSTKRGVHGMGLKDLLRGAASLVGVGQTSLREAYVNKQAPRGSGVYRVYYRGQLMKVGKAPDGLRKRFSDYYRGEEGGTAHLKYITKENRDQVMVMWQECPKDRARAIETSWYDQAKAGGEEMPWSERR